MADTLFRNTPVDQRRLTEKDRSDFRRGAAQRENKQHKRIKARTAAINYRSSKPPRTGSQEGTGGFLRGRQIQQLRMREMGQQKRREEALRTVA